MQELDIRDVAIIDAFPVYSCEKEILTVGCGEGRIEYHLHKMGYDVVATDVERMVLFEEKPGLIFEKMDIFNPVLSHKRSIVICSEVLEHLRDYRLALKNLLKLLEVRLIVTVPFERSFDYSDHCNYWSDAGYGMFKDINEFKELCRPYLVSISKMRTKPRDVGLRQWDYLIIVDKRQKYEE